MATWVQSDAPDTRWSAVTSDSSGIIMFACFFIVGGIWRSANSGENWSQLNIIGTTWNDIASSSDGIKVVAVSRQSNPVSGFIYTSTNSGTNWTEVTFPFTNWSSVASSSDGTILVACEYEIGGRIWRSTNSGQNWSQTTAPAKPWLKVASNSDGTRLVAGIDGSYPGLSGGGGVYVSIDSGTSWTLTSLPSSLNVWSGVASSSRGKNLVACDSSGGIYTYTYGGDWSLTTAPTTGWKSVASDSAGRNLVAVGTSKIYISANSGETWTQTSSFTASWSGVASNSLGTKLVAVINDITGASGGIYTYNNPSALVCFLEGSKILTDKGYVLIQDLRKGDLIQTWKHGYKPIDMIGKKEFYNPACNERIKDQLYKYSQDKYPEVFEDLIITGSHSILVDNFKDPEQREKTRDVLGDIYGTDYKYRLPACVDEKSTIYEKKGTCTIYHLALENEHYYANYGIYANGLLVETCSKRYLRELADMTLIE
jgi:hypothetical protein